MSRHTGKNGLVKLASDAVLALTGFDIEESVGVVDMTACGDTAETHDTLPGSWGGTINMNADHGGTGQDLRAGASVAFEGYTEGDSSGKTYLSGQVTVESMSIGSPHDGKVTREYKVKGNGALTVAVVA